MRLSAPGVKVRVDELRGAPDRAILERLYPLYLHDLSSFTDHFRLDAEARWRPDYLAEWLGRPECRSLLIRADRVPAGFTFVAEPPFPFMDADAQFKVVEFFVSRPWRRRGVGAAAARALFAASPGAWQLDVIAANERARAFWRAIVPHAVESRDRARDALVLRFDA